MTLWIHLRCLRIIISMPHCDTLNTPTLFTNHYIHATQWHFEYTYVVYESLYPCHTVTLWIHLRCLRIIISMPHCDTLNTPTLFANHYIHATLWHFEYTYVVCESLYPCHTVTLWIHLRCLRIIISMPHCDTLNTPTLFTNHYIHATLWHFEYTYVVYESLYPCHTVTLWIHLRCLRIIISMPHCDTLNTPTLFTNHYIHATLWHFEYTYVVYESLYLCHTVTLWIHLRCLRIIISMPHCDTLNTPTLFANHYIHATLWHFEYTYVVYESLYLCHTVTLWIHLRCLRIIISMPHCDTLNTPTLFTNHYIHATLWHFEYTYVVYESLYPCHTVTLWIHLRCLRIIISMPHCDTLNTPTLFTNHYIYATLWQFEYTYVVYKSLYLCHTVTLWIHLRCLRIIISMPHCDTLNTPTLFTNHYIHATLWHFEYTYVVYKSLDPCHTVRLWMWPYECIPLYQVLYVFRIRCFRCVCEFALNNWFSEYRAHLASSLQLQHPVPDSSRLASNTFVNFDLHTLSEKIFLASL